MPDDKASTLARLKRASEVSRLKLEDSEIASFSAELDSLLQYFSQVQKVKEAKVKEEKLHDSELREDILVKKDYADRLVEKFTKKDGRYLVAPRSLESG